MNSAAMSATRPRCGPCARGPPGSGPRGPRSPSRGCTTAAPRDGRPAPARTEAHDVTTTRADAAPCVHPCACHAAAVVEPRRATMTGRSARHPRRHGRARARRRRPVEPGGTHLGCSCSTGPPRSPSAACGCSPEDGWRTAIAARDPDDAGPPGAAAVRGAAEECGRLVDRPGRQSWPSPTGPRRRSHPDTTPTWFFRARVPRGEVVVDGGEILDHSLSSPRRRHRRPRPGSRSTSPPPTWMTLDALRSATDISGRWRAR